mmetsp:Transcript_10530/g.19768  ORF Transcript_10530/g.19768 Transcript_10530/m.19768 type:complete len:85 (-) Transcript_10530:1940-2194(-)
MLNNPMKYGRHFVGTAPLPPPAILTTFWLGKQPSLMPREADAGSLMKNRHARARGLLPHACALQSAAFGLSACTICSSLTGYGP